MRRSVIQSPIAPEHTLCICPHGCTMLLFQYLLGDCVLLFTLQAVAPC